MRRLLAGLAPWIALLLVGLASVGLALAQLAVPALVGHVVDTTGVLTSEQNAQLDAKLTAFELSRGSQVAVLLVPSTQPEDIASYANRVANTWKIGRKGVGDGLLLVVALTDRKVRIEVAKTLEGPIPDLAAKRIIDEAITPRFKQGDYAGGLDAGVTRIMGLIVGEALPAPTQTPGTNFADDFDWVDLGIFMFIAIPVVGVVARGIFGSRLGAVATGGLAGGIAMLVTASLLISVLAGMAALVFTLISSTPSRRSGGWGGGGGWGTGGSSGGGSSFGGGFSSGGGGDFGGGGASGDW